MRRRTFVSALLAAAALPAARERLLAQLQVADPIVGLNAHNWNDRALRAYRELGIRHIRMPAILQLWEETDRHPADLRNIGNQAERAGIRVLWYLHNIPEGYSRNARLRDRERWMERMTRFAEWAARLPGTEALQLWNEQDQWLQTPFGAAQRTPLEERGRLYADQLHLAYPRIKEVNPDVLVVSGGTADYKPSQGAPAFLRGMLESDPPVDAIGVHAYGAWPAARRLLAAAREVVGSRPIWQTEFGHDQANGSGPPDLREHLRAWQTTIEGNGREHLAQRQYGYTLQTDPRPQFSQHGLFEPDGVTPRPTYEWLRRRARG